MLRRVNGHFIAVTHFLARYFALSARRLFSPLDQKDDHTIKRQCVVFRMPDAMSFASVRVEILIPIREVTCIDLTTTPYLDL